VTHTFIWTDIGYAATITPHGNGASADVKAYATGGAPGDLPPRYRSKSDANRWVTDLSEAEVEVEGFVRWDGCSNFDFMPDSATMTHFCGKTAAVNLGVMLGRVYDAAKGLIPDADEHAFL
jgi:hypothetical protein